MFYSPCEAALFYDAPTIKTKRSRAKEPSEEAGQRMNS